MNLRTHCARITAALAAISLLHSPRISAQSQRETAPVRTASPAFDVASVRPSNPRLDEINGFYTYPGGRIVGKGCTLQYLIMIAFNVQDFQVSGGPDWMKLVGGERFDVQAKPPDSSNSAQWKTSSPKIYPGQEEREMLQSLLADRFHLTIHRELREGPVLLLTTGRGDLKLTPSKDENEFQWAGGIRGGVPSGDGLRGTNISMPQLASRLSQWLRRPVIDQTGIRGSFDFEVHSGEGDSNSSADLAASILTSIKEIGLNLKSSQGPVEMIVVDHIERPSPN